MGCRCHRKVEASWLESHSCDSYIYKIYMAQKAVDRGDIRALNESAADAVAKASVASVMKTAEFKR